jgi:hypothetical protein
MRCCTFSPASSQPPFSIAAICCSVSSWRAIQASAPCPVTASMRRTPEAMPLSATILNRPMSPARRTWQPPHSSIEKSPSFSTRTRSSYFSPNSASAPPATASS